MLDRTMFFIREHVGMLKLSDTYDILDPETQEPIGIAKEKVSGLMIALRFLINKRFLPTKVKIYNGTNPEDESQLVFSIDRGYTFLRSKVNVVDSNGQVVGWFKQKMLSIGGAFFVFDSEGTQIAMVKGEWKGFNFRFLDNNEEELGTVTKKWTGLGKELFTSADNYIVSLEGEPGPAKAMLLLAAALAIDTVFKEV